MGILRLRPALLAAVMGGGVAAPTGLTATAISSTRIDLAWTDAATTETEYRVYRSADGVTYALIDTIAADSVAYSDTTCAASTQYWYKVAAYGAGGEALSDADDATTPPTGMCDATPSLAHFYQFACRVFSSYTGNLVRLRRDADDAEADFGYVAATNELNVAAIATWLGAGTAHVVTIYDQKGGDNITQATKTAQPLYVASAKNGHAGMSFDGGDWLRGAYTNGGALSQPVSVFAVAQLDATFVNDNVYHYITDGDDASNMVLLKDASTAPDVWSIYAGTAVKGSAANANWNVWSALFNGASSQFWINGASQATGNAGAENADGLTVGADCTSVVFWKGSITSVVICDPSHNDTQRGAMQTALNAYWAVY